uniref:Uncharacterized protein n=1 Tax=Pygocentrus nattereri TaxID=42514 RepID=A0A3B4BSJ7_PYGNA
ATPPDKTDNEVTALETGFRDTNSWIDWIHYTVHTSGACICYVCSTAKPVLPTAPCSALLNDRDRTSCLLTLLSSRTVPNYSVCANMHWKFPPVRKIGNVPPIFEPAEGNYTCFTRQITL